LSQQKEQYSMSSFRTGRRLFQQLLP
jgi:hypothetical protein